MFCFTIVSSADFNTELPHLYAAPGFLPALVRPAVFTTAFVCILTSGDISYRLLATRISIASLSFSAFLYESPYSLLIPDLFKLSFVLRLFCLFRWHSVISEGLHLREFVNFGTGSWYISLAYLSSFLNILLPVCLWTSSLWMMDLFDLSVELEGNWDAHTRLGGSLDKGELVGVIKIGG